MGAVGTGLPSGHAGYTIPVEGQVQLKSQRDHHCEREPLSEGVYGGQAGLQCDPLCLVI